MKSASSFSSLLSIFLVWGLSWINQIHAQTGDLANGRSNNYDAMWVEVGGKLALCSHNERGNITLTVHGGKPPYKFKWNNNDTTQNRTNLNAGSYTVLITDSEGQILRQQILIQPPYPLILNPIEKKDATCSSGQDGYAKISISTYHESRAPYTITWSNGLKDIWEADNLAPGTYFVTVSDKFNCEIKTSFDILSKAEGLTVTESIQDVSCSGTNSGKIELNVFGGVYPYTYNWSNGATSQNLIGIGAGSYQVVIKDAQGCSFQAVFTVKAAKEIQLREEILHPSCEGKADGSINLAVSGGRAPFTYQWSNGSTQQFVENLNAGNYKVRITDAAGCAVDRQFSLINQSNLKIDAIEVTPVSCEGKDDGTIRLSITGAKGELKIEWLDDPSAPADRSNLKAGTYQVKIMDESGCELNQEISVQQNTPLQARIESALEMNCETGEMKGRAWVKVSGGKMPYSFQWSNPNLNGDKIEFFQSGVLKVAVMDALDCEIVAEATITLPNLGNQSSRLNFDYRKLVINNEPEVLVDEEIIFESEISSEFIALEWEFGDGEKSSEENPIHVFRAPGSFLVRLTGYDSYGCDQQKSSEIIVRQPKELMAIPNAFTPNGDGLNDTFIPKMNGIVEFRLQVFNLWGEQLFEGAGIQSKGWDGTYKGQLIPAGNYIYRIDYVTWEGHRKSANGSVTLIR